jgi:hypothetical protein
LHTIEKNEQTEVFEGFVIGNDVVGKHRKMVWKVRVMSKGLYNGRKFEVGTTHILLEKGLKVQFATAEFLVGKDRKVRKAVEVQLIT